MEAREIERTSNLIINLAKEAIIIRIREAKTEKEQQAAFKLREDLLTIEVLIKGLHHFVNFFLLFSSINDKKT